MRITAISPLSLHDALPILVRNARGNQHRSVNRRSHVQSSDFCRLFQQLVSPTRTVLARHNRLVGQLLVHLSRDRGRNTVLGGDRTGGAVMVTSMQPPVLDRKQALSGFPAALA